MLGPGDSVFVLRERIEGGERVLVEGRAVMLDQALGLGHKIARVDLAEGERVVKYGAPIGRASCAIAAGDHVHLHNLRSDYTPTHGRGGHGVAA